LLSEKFRLKKKFNMQNDAGEYVDLYIPRKWQVLTLSKYLVQLKLTFHNRSSASNRIIHAKDHAAIQINIAEVNEVTGVMSGTYKTYAICGSIRVQVSISIIALNILSPTNFCFYLTFQGESDDCLTRLAKKDGILGRY
jgi:small subunit ribosomal protein S21e